jgi:hypothetical protein
VSVATGHVYRFNEALGGPLRAGEIGARRRICFPSTVGLLVRFLRIKETYLVLGLLLLGVAGVTYFTARPSQPVEIDGTESSYVEVTQSGAYDRNELQLQGDSATYTLDKTKFHPTMPDQVYKHGKIQIWVDQGSTTIIAITLYDQNDENPTKYTTDHYDSPASQLADTQASAFPLGILGLGLIGIFVVWFAVARRQRTPIRTMEPASALPINVGETTTGLSPDGKWFWDGLQWRNVSADGRNRWDGAQWRQLETTSLAEGAPPPPQRS